MRVKLRWQIAQRKCLSEADLMAAHGAVGEKMEPAGVWGSRRDPPLRGEIAKLEPTAEIQCRFVEVLRTSRGPTNISRLFLQSKMTQLYQQYLLEY